MTDISREVCEEYLDALVTVELSVRFAQLEDRKMREVRNRLGTNKPGNDPEAA